MYSNYFEKCRTNAKLFDERLAALTAVWQMPKLLIGGYEECTPDTARYVDAIQADLQRIQDDISETFPEESSLLQDEDDMDRLLTESEEAYKDLKKLCDDLDVVLAEYDYRYDEDDTVDQPSEEMLDSSTDLASGMKSLEFEVTPKLTGKHKMKIDAPYTPTPNATVSRMPSTPLVNNLLSATKTELSKSQEHFGVCTPLRQRPQEPIYSAHFYKIMKNV